MDNSRDNALKMVSMRRFVLPALLFIGLTAAGLYVVYDWIGAQGMVFDRRLVTPRMLAGAALLLTVYFASDGLRLYFTLRAIGERIRLRVLFKLVFINLFFSNITPMATGGGFAQIWYLQHHGIKVGRASSATTIRTILAIIFIFSLTPVFLLTLEPLKNTPVLGQIGLVLAVLSFLYLGFFAIVLFRARWLIGVLSAVLSMLHRLHLLGVRRHQRWQYKARREMLRFSRSFMDYLHGPKRFVLLSVLCTFLFLISLFSFPALLIAGLGYDLDYLTTLGLMVVTTFVMYFSPTPGASGISEGTFAAFFQSILSGNHLILVTVGWRFLTVYLGMLAGLVIVQREIVKNGMVNEST